MYGRSIIRLPVLPLMPPMPLRLTGCSTTRGERLNVLSLKFAAPVKAPVFCGVKLKLSEHDAPGASENPLEQVEVPFSTKLAPRDKATVPASVWLPTFCSETDCGPFVLPTLVMAKL